MRTACSFIVKLKEMLNNRVSSSIDWIDDTHFRIDAKQLEAEEVFSK